MKRVASVCLLLIIALAGTGFAAPKKKTMVVFGSNNIAVDRAAIQDAIDNAPKNGTVILDGTFQLDGDFVDITRGHITIEGRAIDDDGDGAINEDWADGVDNDGDGSVDEDDWNAIVKGLIDGGTGEPEDDILPPLREFHNRGFAVWGADGTYNQITIRNITFTGLNRGIEFVPDVKFAGALRCDQADFTGGEVKNAVVEGNRFDNVDRGFGLFGEAHNVRVSGNLFTDWVRGAAAVVVGDRSTCFNADGTPDITPLGTPSNTRFDNNTFAGDPSPSGITVVRTIRTRITHNTIDSASGGIFVFDDPKAHITDNLIANVFQGIELGGALDQQIATRNLIDNASVYGIFFDNAVGGSAIDNDFTNSGGTDYFLNEGSSDNKVRLKLGQSVIDLGTDNDIQ